MTNALASAFSRYLLSSRSDDSCRLLFAGRACGEPRAIISVLYFWKDARKCGNVIYFLCVDRCCRVHGRGKNRKGWFRYKFMIMNRIEFIIDVWQVKRLGLHCLHKFKTGNTYEFISKMYKTLKKNWKFDWTHSKIAKNLLFHSIFLIFQRFSLVCLPVQDRHHFKTDTRDVSWPSHTSRLYYDAAFWPHNGASQD